MMKVAVFPNPWSTSWFRENLQEGVLWPEKKSCEKKQVSLTDSKQEVRTWFQERPAWPDKPGPAHQELSRPRTQSLAVKVQAAKVILISEKDNCDQQQKII